MPSASADAHDGATDLLRAWCDGLTTPDLFGRLKDFRQNTTCYYHLTQDHLGDICLVPIVSYWL